MVVWRSREEENENVTVMRSDLYDVICKIDETERIKIINSILKIFSDNKVPGYFIKEMLKDVELIFDYASTISI